MFPQGLANQCAWKQKLNEKKMGNTLLISILRILTILGGLQHACQIVIHSDVL